MVSKHEMDLSDGGQNLVFETNLPGYELLYRGKVRDTYRFGENLLMIATDRVSAFDVVLPTVISDKGRILNLLSAFWFRQTSHIVPNHLIGVFGEITRYTPPSSLEFLSERSMIVKKAKRIDVECVVRGYLSGSAWAEYSKNGTIHGQPAPSGLRESDKLPEPIFTPTTKAETGHDQPISIKNLVDLVGSELAGQLEEKTTRVYQFAADFARERGIIIADTKMEFGFIDGQLCLIDELLTPDSSRFWDLETYQPGGSQPSFDKQFLRDWLTASGWNREPPVPQIPTDVVLQTAEKYREAYRRLTGKSL